MIEKTFYLKRDIKTIDGKRFHRKGQTIQTSDEDMIKHIESELAKPLEKIPITKGKKNDLNAAP